MQTSSLKLACKNIIDSATNQNQNNHTQIPYFNFDGEKMVIFPRIDGFKKAHKVSDKSIDNLKNDKLTGKISDATTKKIHSILTNWLTGLNLAIDKNKQLRQPSKYYPVFATLTLASTQAHTDAFIRRNMLGRFIQEVKRKFDVVYYFHRSESQKNGNIHFHVLLDKFIPYDSILTIWNNIQADHGYIEEFKKRNGDKIARSVNVKAVKDVKNFTNYVIKYMTKEEESRPIKGRIWGMSDELRNLKKYTDVIDSKINTCIDLSVNSDSVEIFQSDHFTIIYFNENAKETPLYKLLKSRSDKYYLDCHYTLYYRKPIPYISADSVSTQKKLYPTQAEFKFPR